MQSGKQASFGCSGHLLGQPHVNSHFHCDVEGRMDIRGTVAQLEKPGNNATDYLPIQRLRKIGGRVNVRALDTR